MPSGWAVICQLHVKAGLQSTRVGNLDIAVISEPPFPEKTQIHEMNPTTRNRVISLRKTDLA